MRKSSFFNINITQRIRNFMQLYDDSTNDNSSRKSINLFIYFLHFLRINFYSKQL